VRIRRIVPADIPAVAAIHVAAWRANYRGMIPDEAIDARTVEYRRSMWARLTGEPRRITLVSCDEQNAVTGFASAFLLSERQNGFDSFLQMMFVDEALKGRGIGRELLITIVGALRNLGAQSMALRTLRANPARTFYERLGAELVETGIDIDEGEFDDVVYGFRDLNALVTSS
jgi:GNAT superfamily N-acetyltransferase